MFMGLIKFKLSTMKFHYNKNKIRLKSKRHIILLYLQRKKATDEEKNKEFKKLLFTQKEIILWITKLVHNKY